MSYVKGKITFVKKTYFSLRVNNKLFIVINMNYLVKQLKCGLSTKHVVFIKVFLSTRNFFSMCLQLYFYALKKYLNLKQC